MKQPLDDFGLYVIITDADYSITHITELAVKHGVKMLQLREKEMSDQELLTQLSLMMQITKNSETKVIINDRIDLALVSGCDGYHLGQDDIPYSSGRKIIPKDRKMFSGLSTHSVEQVKEAMLYKPDYIGFGPIYPTFAKKKPDAAVGCESLREVLSISQCPVVAIGGINRENVQDVLKSGAKNIAMIKSLVKAHNMEEEMKIYTELLRR